MFDQPFQNYCLKSVLNATRVIKETLDTKNPNQNGIYCMTQHLKLITGILPNSNFSELTIFLPLMGHRWGAVWASDLNAGMDHAWETMRSQYG